MDSLVNFNEKPMLTGQLEPASIRNTMTFTGLISLMGQSSLNDLLKEFEIRRAKKAAFTSLVLIHRKVFTKVMLAWRRAAELSYLNRRLGIIKGIARQNAKNPWSSRTKTRKPIVEIKTTRTKESVPKSNPATANYLREIDLGRTRSTSSGLTKAKSIKQSFVPDSPKSTLKGFANTMTSSSRALQANTFKSPKPQLDRAKAYRSSSVLKSILNSSGLLDQSPRLDRSRSPATNLGTRLYLQAEVIRLRKEQLRQAYEHDNTYTNQTTFRSIQKKLSAASLLKIPRHED